MVDAVQDGLQSVRMKKNLKNKHNQKKLKTEKSETATEATASVQEEETLLLNKPKMKLQS